MSYTCFEPEGSSSGRRYGIEHTLLLTRLLIPMYVKHAISYHNCIYKRLPEDEPSGSKHVEDIIN
jgi:hypothetical protein